MEKIVNYITIIRFLSMSHRRWCSIIQYGENPESVRQSNENRTLYLYKPVKEGNHFYGYVNSEGYKYCLEDSYKDYGNGTCSVILNGSVHEDVRLSEYYESGNMVKLVAGEDATINGLNSLIIETEDSYDISSYVQKKQGIYLMAGMIMIILKDHLLLMLQSLHIIRQFFMQNGVNQQACFMKKQKIIRYMELQDL